MSENPSKELSVPDAPSNGGLLERFDLADDKKIIEAMAKRVTAGFTYKVNGKHGLSSAGALWAAREFAKQGEVYRVQGEPKIEICPLDPECINVWVKVQRFFVNPATGQEIALDSTFGHKRMSRKTKRYKDDSGTDFDMVEDPEFTTKAITKAERNGKLKLMPKDAVTNMIAKATGQVVQGATPPKGNTAPPKGNTAPPKETAKPVTPPAGASGGTPLKEEAKKPEEPKKTEEVKKPEEAKKVDEPKKTEEPKKAAAPPAAPADKPKMSKEVMVQKLDAVCKMVFNTQDGAIARQKLAVITGKPSPGDLSDDDIKKVGNAINAVAKKTAEIVGNDIVKLSDKSILWKGPEVVAPPAEAPAEGGETGEEMF